MTTRVPNVLVVDDDQSMRTTLVDILASEGYRALAASTGEDALEICAREDVDVVLMDLRMPGMNGLEAFRRIRMLERGIRCVLMSAHGSDALQHAALDDGAVAFLSKPLQIDDVLKLVAAVNSTSILIVSDDEPTRARLSGVLRERGFLVSTPTMTSEALDSVRQVRFDIAFIDVDLGTMSGLDFYIELRRLASTTVAIMLHEADPQLEAIADEAVRRTAYSKIVKPIEDQTLTQLLEVVSRQLASQSLRKPKDADV